MPIEDLFDTGLFTTRLEKLDSNVFALSKEMAKNLQSFGCG